MPQAIAQWVATKVVAFAAQYVTGNVLSAIAAVAYIGTYVAATAAISAGLAAFQSTPDIEGVKGSKKQSIPPRMKVWGRRGKIGGYYTLWEAVKNYAYDVVYFAEGPIEAVEQVWSHDKVLSFVGGGVGGWVANSPEYGGGANDLIHIELRTGLTPSTAFPAMVTALGGDGLYTATARGDGLVMLGADYHHAKKENLLADFPQNEPNWSLTALWTPVWDPRVPAQEWGQPFKSGAVQSASGNLGLQILDHCMDPRGMAMDYASEIAPALAHWISQLDICDEPIPLAAGGTEPRYHGSGFAALPDDPQNALDKMLAACDGKMLKDQYGVWRLWVGKYQTPTIHILEDDIGDYQFDGDSDAQDQVNEVIPQVVSEAAGWTLVPATEWRDEAAVDRIGRVMSSPLALEWCNSIPTGRRVGKAVLGRNGADLRGRLNGRLSAAEALGQRWILVTLPELGLDAAPMEMNDGGRLVLSRACVELNLIAADPTLYDWDAATEEDSPVVVTRPPVEPLTPPVITLVTSFAAPLGTAYALRLHVEGSGPDREDLTWFVGWQSADSTSWSSEEITDEAAGPPFAGDTGFVPSDTALQVRLGYQTGLSGIQWSAPEAVGPFGLALMAGEDDALILAEDGSPMMME